MAIRKLIATVVPRVHRQFISFRKIHFGRRERGSVRLANIQVLAQEVENWCWAACAAMVSAYYGMPTSQCQIATQWLGQPCCDTHHRSDVCNVPLKHLDMLGLYAQMGLQGKHRPYWISHRALLEELSRGYPVQVAHVSCKGGHASLVVGGGTDSEQGEYVYVADPALGAERAGYRAFESLRSTGQRSWMDTWTLWR